MKCPECWADKAYRRNEQGPVATMLRCLLFIPMRCRHCYHKFWVHRFLAFGQVIEAPAKVQVVTPTEKSSVAAQFLAQQEEGGSGNNTPRRAA